MTTNYYLSDRLIATRAGSTLSYVHQDALTGTSVTTNSSGTSTGSIKYFSFGDCRNSTGSLSEQKFTGQRLDSTGLYYYGARYYDPTIGRFISADTIISNPMNPQSLNRYSYCLNNPLKYIDPTGHDQIITSLGDDKYAICDGSGKLLAVATGLDDLANKMDALSAISRDVSLPSASSGQSIDVYLPDTKSKDGVYTLTKYIWDNGILQSKQDTYRYTYNPYDTHFPFRQGNKWEGRWNRYYGRTEQIDCGQVGQVTIGTVELVVGVPLAIVGSVLTLVVAIPGAYVAETPMIVTSGMAYIGIQLTVDGLNRVSVNELQLDIGWIQWP